MKPVLLVSMLLWLNACIEPCQCFGASAPHRGLVGRRKGALQLSAAAIILKCAYFCRSEDCAMHFHDNEAASVCPEHRSVMVTHWHSVVMNRQCVALL